MERKAVLARVKMAAEGSARQAAEIQARQTDGFAEVYPLVQTYVR